MIKDLFMGDRYYMDHPEDYHKHPAMFLGQVSHDDNEADGCAAQCERLKICLICRLSCL